MLAIETILGALTGYFTNDIAIRQLFSEKGLVVREREQFTSLIVQVLKDNIIDADTIDLLRERPEMVAFFDEFVHAIFNEALPSALLEKRLSVFDENGALQGILKGHIAEAAISEARLDAALVHAHLDTWVQSEDFKQALSQAIQHVATLSIKDLGLAAVLEEVFVAFESMDDDAWQTWLTEQQEQIFHALANETASTEDEKIQSVKALLSVDGEILVRKVEVYLGIDFSASEQQVNFKERYTHFLEQLYVFAARVLPQVLEAHLPAFVDAFYPMLQADRQWLEQMVLDSIEACNTDGNMILSVASGYVQKFFAPDASGRDWLTRLYDTLIQADENNALCTRVADFLCGLIMKQIDEWRRLDLDDEDAVRKVHAYYQAGRAWAVKMADAYLDMPAQGNSVHRIVLKSMVSMAFAWLRQSITVENMRDFLEKYKEQLIEQSFEALFFNEKRQAQAVDYLCDWWHSEGKAWLLGLDVNEKSVKALLYKVVDEIFDTPIGRFVDYLQGLLPYEQMADSLRGLFFGQLRDFLAGLTQEQLEALTHEEIREVVLDMIGREMRPLAYLGGGIGAIAGVATGAAMKASGVSVDQEQLALVLAARSGMYGAVGYGTNVMAVKGLFWPYKKTLGLQGLISKNQTRFANKMKSMAENYIINEEIWMQQVARVSERIGQHDDEILRYGLHLMDQNREHVVRPLVEMVSTQLPQRLCRGLFSEAQMVGLMQKLATTGIQCYLNHRTVGNVAVRFQWLHRGICKVAMAEANERVWSDKITKTLHGLSEERWVALGNGVLQHWYLPKNEAVYEKAWQHILPIYQDLSSRLLRYTHEIAGALGDYISKKLSFPLQLAYRMASGDRQIERVVAYFIEHQLPDYLALREEQVQMQLKRWAMAQFAGRHLMDCGVTLSEAQGQWLAQWSQGIQADLVHRHILNLLVHIEKWPNSYLDALTKDVSVVVAPILEVGAQCLQEMKMTSYIKWALLAERLSPVLDIARKEAFCDVSIAEMLSLSELRFWAWCDEIFRWSHVEKNSVITCTQGLWRDVAPTFWQTIGQRGRVLMMMIDIPTLTYDRICALSPQELEVMVRDIAQPYFTRVERMGWLGAVVAIPATIISMILGGM